MQDRNNIQVVQAKPENQVPPKQQPEHSINADLDSDVLLSAIVLHQGTDEIPTFIAGFEQNDRSVIMQQQLLIDISIYQTGQEPRTSNGFILSGNY